MKDTSDITSREYKMQRRRYTLRCALCRPHRGENDTRYGRGAQKPKKHRTRCAT